MTPQQAADDFDRAAMVTARALEDLGRAWLNLPVELRRAIAGETAGGGVTVGNEAFGARVYEIPYGVGHDGKP